MLRDFTKSLANLLSFALVLPFFVLYCVFVLFGDRGHAFWSLSQWFSRFPGKTGSYLRKGFYRLTMTRCELDCAIMFGTIFAQADTEIGKHVYIGANCNIGCSVIEDYCTLGSGVHILSGKQQHRFEDLDIPIREQGGVFEKVRIGEDTWIGNGAIVMANIGRKCIIGAGSVVTHDLPDYSIAAGNPARVIRSRKPDKVQLAEN